MEVRGRLEKEIWRDKECKWKEARGWKDKEGGRKGESRRKTKCKGV